MRCYRCTVLLLPMHRPFCYRCTVLLLPMHRPVIHSLGQFCYRCTVQTDGAMMGDYYLLRSTHVLAKPLKWASVFALACPLFFSPKVEIRNHSVHIPARKINFKPLSRFFADLIEGALLGQPFLGGGFIGRRNSKAIGGCRAKLVSCPRIYNRARGKPAALFPVRPRKPL